MKVTLTAEAALEFASELRRAALRTSGKTDEQARNLDSIFSKAMGNLQQRREESFLDKLGEILGGKKYDDA